ncbi:MAG: T9SS type A sorting domain-containing protein [Reichenbachiella sp.]|uniref:T9SS type A sorting domain-containing protein n=1 Tax=Reichenbachiella sp. TaxID=2184521 RepID=UPI0029666D2B|nr:T9SS type A sorting domain-containing protein [Reichenbachiella sp.]MDW3208559.1 T9SS type A sorting domain-containing protein [Reichenbachiella sp.]
MRILLLAICLLPSSFLLSQNLQHYPAPLPEDGHSLMLEPEAILNDPLSVGYPAFAQHSNQRTAYVDQSATNEGDRLIFDSLIWEVYDEEKNAWEFSSMYWYERDERGNPLLYIYQLYDSENQKWVHETKREKVFNDDDLETSFIEYSWDKVSEAWVNSLKTIQSYDENGNKTLYDRYNWNIEQAEWEGHYKDVSEFDEDGNRTLYEHYNNWDQVNGLWIGDEKSQTWFNDKNEIIERIYSVWNSDDGNWVNSKKNAYTYNASDQLVLHITYEWDDSGDDWVSAYKDEYEYNEDASLKSRTHYYSNPFILESKFEYTYNDQFNTTIIRYDYSDPDTREYETKNTIKYNDNNQVLEYYQYEWDDISEEGSWKLSNFGINEYDDNGFKTLSESSYWDDELNIEVKSLKTVHTYTEEGRVSYYRHFQWNSDHATWEGIRGYNYTYDDRGYTIDEERYRGWDFETNSWVGEYRYTYEVNDHAKRKSSNYYNWIDGGWKHTYRATYYHHVDCSSSSIPVHNYLTLEDQTELCSVESLVAPTAIGCGGDLTATTDAEFPIETVGTHEVTWTYNDGNGNTSTQTQKVIIDQSCQPLSVELNNLVEVYPNPSLGQINFKQKIDEVEIFNQNGQLEMQILSPGSSINVSKLKAGIYYLTLKYQMNTARVKIIKN